MPILFYFADMYYLTFKFINKINIFMEILCKNIFPNYFGGFQALSFYPLFIISNSSSFRFSLEYH